MTGYLAAPDRLVEYYGNVPYCYANSVAMVLSGRDIRVSPGLIEVLTGVGLGAVRTDNGLTFFSTTPANVPGGLDTALDILGFAFTSVAGPDDADAADILRRELATGPVILGPLDMGYLTYLPGHDMFAGSDHYVVAHAIDDTRVYLHCPQGFPATTLSFADLTAAWRAERIGYRGGPYQRWLNPRRVAEPTAEQIYDRALAHFAAAYRAQPDLGGVVGPKAIRQLADDVRAGSIPQGLVGFLAFFALPLGARRAGDYARFFAGGGDTRLSAAKLEQAQLFGDAVQATHARDWARLADTLARLADTEADVEQAVRRSES
jgi:hypothetical protein